MSAKFPSGGEQTHSQPSVYNQLEFRIRLFHKELRALMGLFGTHWSKQLKFKFHYLLLVGTIRRMTQMQKYGIL